MPPARMLCSASPMPAGEGKHAGGKGVRVQAREKENTDRQRVRFEDRETEDTDRQEA